MIFGNFDSAAISDDYVRSFSALRLFTKIRSYALNFFIMELNEYKEHS